MSGTDPSGPRSRTTFRRALHPSVDGGSRSYYRSHLEVLFARWQGSRSSRSSGPSRRSSIHGAKEVISLYDSGPLRRGGPGAGASDPPDPCPASLTSPRPPKSLVTPTGADRPRGRRPSPRKTLADPRSLDWLPVPGPGCVSRKEGEDVCKMFKAEGPGEPRGWLLCPTGRPLLSPGLFSR